MFGGWFVRQLNWFVIYAVATRACGPSQHQGLNTEEWGIQAPGKSCNLSLPQATQHRGAGSGRAQNQPQPGMGELAQSSSAADNVVPLAGTLPLCRLFTGLLSPYGQCSPDWIEGQKLSQGPAFPQRSVSFSGPGLQLWQGVWSLIFCYWLFDFSFLFFLHFP